GEGYRRRHAAGIAERARRTPVLAFRLRLAPVPGRRRLGFGLGLRRGIDLGLHAGDQVLEAGRLLGQPLGALLLVRQRGHRPVAVLAALLDQDLNAGPLLGERRRVGAETVAFAFDLDA